MLGKCSRDGCPGPLAAAFGLPFSNSQLAGVLPVPFPVCLAGLAYLRNGTEPVYLPRIRWNAPSQNPQKSGFSRPVGANEANPVPLLYNKMVNCQEPSVPVFLP